jgi:hypothetical protein
MPKDDSCDSRLRFRFSEQVSARWQNAPAFSGRQLGRKVAALGAEDFGLRVWEAVPRLVQGRDSAFAVNLGGQCFDYYFGDLDRKNGEKMALLTQSEAKLYQNLIITFVSENCDHNIGPSFRRKNWRFAVKPMF